MNKTHQSFYKSFYGHKFFRHFRRPTDFKIPRIQFTITNPKQLYSCIDRNSGVHPCLIHVYDHGFIGNLRRQDSERMIFDRAFFDFDVSNPEIKEIKTELIKLRRHGLKFEEKEQEELKEQIKELIINDVIAKPAIDEAKDFAIKFKEDFGKLPMLFFSGCKGAHVYTFFESTKFININRALSFFASETKDAYDYQTLDLSVNKDAKSRLSRVPYSKHQYTGLTVTPFYVEDSYDDILNKSLFPIIESFNKTEYLTDFNLHLQSIDKIVAYNDEIRKEFRQSKINQKKIHHTRVGNIGKINDHRLFFKSILGDPEDEYPDKEYVMYKCPFNDHEDHKPSFRVHKTGYKCYGCNRKGNYFQYYKDYYGWTNEQVKTHLKK